MKEKIMESESWFSAIISTLKSFVVLAMGILAVVALYKVAKAMVTPAVLYLDRKIKEQEAAIADGSYVKLPFKERCRRELQGYRDWLTKRK